MKRKQKREKKTEADKKAVERMKHYKRIKETLAPKKESAPVAKNSMGCQVYWENSIFEGDDGWKEKVYYYDKKKRGSAFD